MGLLALSHTVSEKNDTSKYRLVEEGYHTWPFGRTALSGMSITAGLTLMGNIAAIVYRMYVVP